MATGFWIIKKYSPWTIIYYKCKTIAGAHCTPLLDPLKTEQTYSSAVVTTKLMELVSQLVRRDLAAVSQYEK